MTWQGRLSVVGVIVSIVVAMEDILAPVVALPLLAVAVALAWRFTEDFWKTVAFGLVGGVIAGVVIMGPGFRLAMRVVAIMDPIKRPEFSVEGTLFIIIGIGGIFGGIFAMAGNLIRKAVPLRSSITSGLVLAGFVMTILLIDSDLREEFTDLGGGPWINIPMFGLFALGYGIAAMAIAEYLQRQAEGRTPAVTEDTKVPA